MGIEPFYSALFYAAIAAPRHKVWSAIKNTTANEIFLFQTLTTIRRFGRPGVEIVIGTYVVQPKRAFATMNFQVDEIAPARFRVSTTTRVIANDPAAQRSFAAYWCIIYPGSSLIRYSWLRAIRTRATS